MERFLGPNSERKTESKKHPVHNENQLCVRVPVCGCGDVIARE